MEAFDKIMYETTISIQECIDLSLGLLLGRAVGVTQNKVGCRRLRDRGMFRDCLTLTVLMNDDITSLY